MSEKYDEYIKTHRENVTKGFNWLVENLPEIFPDEEKKNACKFYCERLHDESKYSGEEYDAYDAYFYGGNRSHEVVENFNYAWLHHIHNNPHHWQYWILINDDPEKGEIILDMPTEYIIEMICDWWSFSWDKGDLHEIFDWYAKHNNYMKLSETTRNKVYKILTMIKVKLESDTDEQN